MMRCCAIGAMVSFCLLSGPASAQASTMLNVDFADIERPLYPELLIEVDDSFSGPTEAFRTAISKASEARVDLPGGGRAYDPEAMLPFLADEVELFVGRGRLALHGEFVSVGKQPARMALEILGRLSLGTDSSDPAVQQRYGMRVLGDLVLEPTVGRSPWLDGRICTASYGQLGPSDWRSLRQKLLMTQREDWLIAVVAHYEDGGLPVQGRWPRRYQMVPESPSQKRSGGSIGILDPDGGTTFFSMWGRHQEGYFASYLNDHVCFEEGKDGWRVTAVAMRLD